MTGINGRHFLQIPGPDQCARTACCARSTAPTIDHRGPEFGKLGQRSARRHEAGLQDQAPVIIFPASGTGAWEAALVNTLSPGDRVLMCETGHFATLWQRMANKLGLVPEFIAGDWRHGADPPRSRRGCAADTQARDQGRVRRA